MAKELYKKLKEMKSDTKTKIKRKQQEKKSAKSTPPPEKKPRTTGKDRNPPATSHATNKSTNKPMAKQGDDVILVEDPSKAGPPAQGRRHSDKKTELEIKLSDKEKAEIEGKAAPSTSTTTPKLDTTSPFYEERRKAYRFIAASHAPFHAQQRQLCDDTHKKLELCRYYNTKKCPQKAIAHPRCPNQPQIVMHFCEICIHALMIPQAHAAADCPIARKRRAAQKEAQEKTA